MLAVHQDAAAKLAPRISTDEYSIGHQIEQVTLKASMVLIIINLMNEKWLSHFGYQGHPAPRRYSHPPPPFSLSLSMKLLAREILIRMSKILRLIGQLA